MQKISFTSAITMALTLIAGQALHGQSAYFQAVTNLSPIGYWPLNETNQPPSPVSITATNSGSLGALGNGYYGAWYQPSGNTFYITNSILESNITAQPLLGQTALVCGLNGTNNGRYVVVPRTIGGVANTNVTLAPPMSVEAWVKPGYITSGVYGIVSEGQANLDYGGPNTNNPFYGGSSEPGWAGFSLGQYTTYFAANAFVTNAESKAYETDSPHTLAVNTWYHVVYTDSGGTETMWVNGALVTTVAHGANGAGLNYVADLTTPLMIAGGNDVASQGGGGNINWAGTIAEVAIYNQVLSSTSIANHYMAGYGTNSGGSPVTYSTVVGGDNPTLYYQLNDNQSQVNAGYPSSTFPVATNYGSLGTNANGVYQPGTTPGVAGPSYVGFGGSSAAVALNGFFGAVDVGYGNIAANCPALNPTGKVPYTVVSWFRGNSADAPARFNSIVGHGSGSYRMYLGTNCGENRFNPGPLTTGTTDVGFANPADMITNHASDNDGNWHMETGVTDGSNAYLYLDGILIKSTNVSAGISIAGSSLDLLLGGDPNDTVASYNTGNTDRTFDGQIAQVAMWNTNLTTAQIQSLYNAAGVPPSIQTQPVGSTNNQGTNVTITTVVLGSQTISYQWYTNGTPVTGQTNEDLLLTNATAGESSSYYLIATNLGGTATSSVVSVVIYGSPVILSQTPTNLDIFAGLSPVLSVNASGAPPIIYQWYSNNILIGSATNSSFTVTNVQTNAVYTCTLTNFVGGGYVSNSPITVNVLPDPTAPYPAQVLANGPIAFWRLDESGGTTAYDDVGGNNGTYTNAYLDVVPSYDPTSDPTEGNAPAFGDGTYSNSYVGLVPTNINFATPTNVNAEFSVECWIQEFDVNTNGTGIVSLGYGNGGEEFCIDCGATANALRFYVRDAAGTSENASSTYNPATNAHWVHVAGVCDEANGHVYLYINGALAATATIPVKSGVFTSTQSLAIGARQSGQGTSYNFQFQGAIDEVALYNYALSSNQVQADYFASGIAPVITQLTPASQTINAGSSATFTVAAAGTPPLSYQWYDPNNNPISTNTTLVITNVQGSNSGTYTITVTNASGSVSSNVTLNVNLGPPTLVQDITPTNQTVLLYSGLDTLTYNFVVSGTVPFSYQWYLNSNSISGATNASYTFTALSGTNTYYVTVTNVDTATQAGGIPLQSSTATVIGVTPPQLNPSNYIYHVEISFPGYQGSPLTNFPALIPLSPSNIAGMDYGQFQGNGSDLRFTDASGTAMVPYEIDEWNDNGLSTVWVQIPVLNGTNIWAYWGNPADYDIPPASSNVWVDAGYQMVYHLKGANFPYADSTGQYPATNGVAPTQASGEVGHGQTFNGTSDYISPGAVTLSNQFTTYAWINVATNATSVQTMWANQVGGYGANGFSWFVNTYNTTNGADHITHFDSGNGAGSGADPTGGTAASFGQWHFTTATWDQVAARVTNYLDGAPNGSGAVVPTFSLTNQLDLGDYINNSLYFTGSMDEARIQYGVASTNWIKTTYLNIANASSFVSFSAINSGPPTLVQDIAPLIQTVELYSGLDTLSYTFEAAGSAPLSYQWYLNSNSISGATNPTYNFTALAGTNYYYVTVTNVNTATESNGIPLQSSTAAVIGLPAPQLNPSNYTYSVEISFPGYQGDPLTNFPALITLNPSNISGMSYSQFQGNGSDLRFTDASGTAMLAYEIDDWNDNGISTVWVQIPVLNGTNIWAYWGNPADYDVPPASSNVWVGAGYQIVYHLKETNFPYADSTGQYPATNGVAPTQAAGEVGHGESFNGTSNYISPGLVTLSNRFTAYAWINIATNASNEQDIWANQEGGYGSNGFSWFVDSYNTADGIAHFDSGTGLGTTNYVGADPFASNAVPFGQWHFMVSTWDQVAARVTNYLDGVPNGAGTAVAAFGLTNQLNLGAFLTPIFYFDGTLDEARIQSGAASTNWITTTYLNMANSSYVSYSTVVSLQPPPPPLLTIVSVTNGYVVLSWTNNGTFTNYVTTNLARTNTIWTPLTNPAPVLTNGVYQQTILPGAGSHFYRLQGN